MDDFVNDLHMSQNHHSRLDAKTGAGTQKTTGPRTAARYQVEESEASQAYPKSERAVLGASYLTSLKRWSSGSAAAPSGKLPNSRTWCTVEDAGEAASPASARPTKARGSQMLGAGDSFLAARASPLPLPDPPPIPPGRVSEGLCVDVRGSSDFSEELVEPALAGD